MTFGRASRPQASHQEQKSFCFFFFRKRRLFLMFGLFKTSAPIPSYHDFLAGRFRRFGAAAQAANPLWLFVHVPKTAGSSMNGELWHSLFPRHHIYIDYAKLTPEEARQDYAALFDAYVDRFVVMTQKRRFRYVTGHLNAAQVARICAAVPSAGAGGAVYFGLPVSVLGDASGERDVSRGLPDDRGVSGTALGAQQDCRQPVARGVAGGGGCGGVRGVADGQLCVHRFAGKVCAVAACADVAGGGGEGADVSPAGESSDGGGGGGDDAGVAGEDCGSEWVGCGDLSGGVGAVSCGCAAVDGVFGPGGADWFGDGVAGGVLLAGCRAVWRAFVL